jgi:ParB-like nuclease domain
MLLDQVNAVRVSTLENGRNGPETESRGPGQHFDGSSPLGSDLRRLDQSVEIIPVNRLASYKGNARTHSQKQVRQIANSIKRFGFLNPVLADDGGQIIAGHGRVEAAKLLGIAAVPVLRITHLTEAEKRAYVLADNRLAELAGWDREILAIELQGLVDIGFEVEATGFSIPDIDLVLEGAAEAQGGPPDREDAIPDVGAVSVSRASDLWVLGEHRLLCGDARDAAAYQILMAGEPAEMAFTDPPYNVRVDRNVCGLGRIRHREFPMASGEMDEGEFTAFLRTAFEHLAAHSEDGAIHFVCMDWRHMG